MSSPSPSILPGSGTLRSADDVVGAGLAPPAARADLARVAERYAVAITPVMADLIDAADPGDPIARQFVPDVAELVTTPEERADPIGDHAHSPLPGLVHRYPDRVLLKFVSVCPVYCRFCFRREMVGPGKAEALSAEDLARILDYVRAHEEVWEVVVTGGDPLVASPRRLKALTEALAAIPHVKVLRFHSRVPVVDPDRVTAGLVDAIRHPGLATWVVLHANHARELTPAARAACARFVDAGIPMLSQSVLLAGVNDDPETLGALMRAFVEARVKPYYLHQGDLAPGTSQFRVPIGRGREILKTLRGRWSGLCQPDYVLDIPGGHGKAPIGPDYLETDGEGFVVTDFKGGRHVYPPVGDRD